MTIRSRGIKKSLFPANVVIDDAATLDFVLTGTNFKITYANFLAGLGVSGSIIQDGDPTGTPILDTQGTVNNIRNIEDGPGIKSSVSAQNGITLEHNFQQSAVGTKLWDDLTVASPTMASLAAGTGVVIAKANNIITISATGILPQTNVVFVNAMTDFPAAVAGVVTLNAGVTYIITNNVSTANRFQCAQNSDIVGYIATGSKLTYTGSGDMFTGLDVGCSFMDVNLDCPTASNVWNFSETVGSTKNLIIRSVSVDNCLKIATINDLQSAFFESVLFSNATNGAQFLGGTFASITFDTVSFVTSSATFVGIDFGTSVSQTIRIRGSFFNGPGSSIGIKGAAANANLTATGTGLVVGNTFLGSLTPVDTINLLEDVNWAGEGNTGLENTHQASLSHNSAGTTVVIATISVGVIIAGTWVDVDSDHFTVNGAGLVTYNGLTPFRVEIDAIVTADPVSGGAQDFKVCVAVNGAVIAASTTPARAAAGDLIAVPVTWQVTLAPGATISLFLQNDSGTTNFNVTKATLRLS